MTESNCSSSSYYTSSLALSNYSVTPDLEFSPWELASIHRSKSLALLQTMGGVAKVVGFLNTNPFRGILGTDEDIQYRRSQFGTNMLKEKSIWKKKLSFRARVRSSLNHNHFSAMTIRQGRWVRVPFTQILVGDIVQLQTGDKAPADALLIEGSKLTFDEGFISQTNDLSVKHSGNPFIHSFTEVVLGHGRIVITSVGEYSSIRSSINTLQFALMFGGMRRAKYLISNNKAALDASMGTQGLSIVHYVAKEGNPSMMQLLIEQGVDLEVVTRKNYLSPLSMAICYNTPEMVRIILKTFSSQKKSIDFVDNEGRTPLFHAIRTRVDSNLLVDLLTAHTKVNRSDRFGWTVLHLSVIYEDLKTLRVVLNVGRVRTLVNRQDSAGYTPLHYACLTGKPNCVNELLTMGAAVNIKTFRGLTPLHCVCMGDRSPMVVVYENAMHIVHKCGKRRIPNVPISNSRCTQRHFIAKRVPLENFYHCAKILLEFSANINQPDSGKLLPLHYVLFGGSALEDSRFSNFMNRILGHKGEGDGEEREKTEDGSRSSSGSPHATEQFSSKYSNRTNEKQDDIIDIELTPVDFYINTGNLLFDKGASLLMNSI